VRAGILAVGATLVVACGVADGPCVERRPLHVQVIDPAGTVAAAFCADQAVTAEERRRGLAGAPPLGPGEGLLLHFPTEGEVCIVNGGVDFPIDALYADRDGFVVAVETGIPAGDDDPRCHPDTERVLEVAAGQAPVAPARLRVR
jgi:uncharacterized membrane protein (UPF0127 family)